MPNERREVPTAALCFTAAEFALGDNGDGAKSAPFRMVARGGDPIDHWHWGRVVHDNDGFSLPPGKSRIAIDYNHDPGEVIGYANRFERDETGALILSGALVPYKDNDRATEVIFKQKAGIPYQSSISFGGKALKIQEVPEGVSTPVNGKEFVGPGIVIREWQLSGCAVCPYGADSSTSTEFNKSETVTVEIEVPEMAEDQKPEELAEEVAPELAEEQQQPEAEAVEAEAVELAEEDNAEVEAEPVEAEFAETVDAEINELSQRAETGERFLDAFGDQGGVWFAQGLSFAEAQAKHVEELVAENERLRSQLASAEGEAEPVQFSNADVPKPVKSIRIAGRNK